MCCAKNAADYTEARIKCNVFSEVDRVPPLGGFWWPFRLTLG